MKTDQFWIATLGIVCASGLAVAGGSWTDNTSFRHSGSGTTLKVSEPEGFRVTVTMPDGSPRSSTVPEVFTFPDQDGYVEVVLTASDGAQWRKKIELRARNQTDLAVSYKADPSGTENARPRAYVGKMANFGNGCGRRYDGAIKAEFLRSSDGAIAETLKLNPKYEQQATLPGGKYDVRVWILGSSGQWEHVVTSNGWDLSRDGWRLGFGCAKGSATPIVSNNF